MFRRSCFYFHPRLLLVTAAALAGLAAAPLAFAQQADPDLKSLPRTTPQSEKMFSSYEGQNVSSIEIVGQPNLDVRTLEPKFEQKAAQPFSLDKVNKTAENLKSGNFKEVRTQVDPAPNGVRVEFILEPAAYFGIYTFPGAKQFTYSRLIQVANYPAQAPFNPAEVQRARQALLQFYREQGYFQAEVSTDLQVDSAHQVVDVAFPAKLGKKAKFGDVVIVGLPNDEQHQLEDSLKGLLARARQASIRPGKTYYRSNVNRASQYLQNELIKKGLLGAQVTLAGADYHAQNNRADIHFDVKPGPEVKVDISGAHLWSWNKKKLLPMYQGAGVDEETVQEGRKALASYFQSKGYFDVKVDSSLKTAPEGDTIVYRISKEKKHKVDDIKITGNTSIKTSDLESHVAVQEHHLLSHGKFSDDLVRSSVKNLKAVYASEGFSNAQVVPTVKRDGGDIDVTFAVTEGPRDVVADLRIEGADTFPAAKYAPGGLQLKAGQPYSAAHINADRMTIVSNYLKAGYLTSSFRETATAVSKADPHHINVVYHIYEGPKVITGDIITLGRNHTDQKLINQDVGILRPEQPLTETNLLTAGTKLYDHTGVFDWAQVDPKREITTQNVEDVLVKVHEAKRNTIQYGFGFEVINRGGSVPSGTVAVPTLPPVTNLPNNFKTSQQTFAGPRGSFQYTRNNVRGKAETISMTAFAGRLDQRAAFYYIDPTLRWSNWKATTSLSYERNEENPIFSSRQEVGTFEMQRPLDASLHNILFFRYSYSATDLTHILIPALVLPEDQHVRLSTVAANFTRDTRDNPLDEHRGVLDSVELDFNTSKLGSNVDFAKLTAQAAYYKQKFHNIVWAESLRIGLAQPFFNSRVPVSEAFFSGGGNTLRGFPLDGAGPQRNVEVCDNGVAGCNQFIMVPAGGNEQLIVNSEARIPVPLKEGLSVVPFYDGGNVFPQVGFKDFSTYSNTVGMGLRYATPVGPIRFDAGYNLNNTVKGVSSFQYFISIGQAF
jgi:outer membrane protein assembly factor BamA